MFIDDGWGLLVMSFFMFGIFVFYGLKCLLIMIMRERIIFFCCGLLRELLVIMMIWCWFVLDLLIREVICWCYLVRFVLFR